MHELGSSALNGKRIVVTRAAGQSAELIRMLKEFGAEVLELPLIRFAEAADLKSLDSALARLTEFDWLIFTSPNAVRFLASRGKAQGVLPFSPAGSRPKVAVVGPSTAAAAEAAGLHADFVALQSTASGLVNELGLKMHGCRVLLSQSDIAKDSLARELHQAGAEVTAVEAYRTLREDRLDAAILAEIRGGHVDAITLASPSAFHALRDALGLERLRKVARVTALVAIGPTTAAAIREAGLPAPVAASAPNSAGLAEAVRVFLAGSQEKEGLAS